MLCRLDRYSAFLFANYLLILCFVELEYYIFSVVRVKVVRQDLRDPEETRAQKLVVQTTTLKTFNPLNPRSIGFQMFTSSDSCKIFKGTMGNGGLAGTQGSLGKEV